MKGAIRPKKTVETPDNLEMFMPPEMNLLPELGEAIPPVPEPQMTAKANRPTTGGARYGGRAAAYTYGTYFANSTTSRGIW